MGQSIYDIVALRVEDVSDNELVPSPAFRILERCSRADDAEIVVIEAIKFVPNC